MIIPMQRNDGSRAALIGVSVATVLVDIKAGVLAGVDANLQWILLLRCGLHNRSERQDASRLHQDWHPVKRSFGHNCLAATIRFACPEIDPSVSSRQDHIAGCRMRLCNWI